MLGDAPARPRRFGWFVGLRDHSSGALVHAIVRQCPYSRLAGAAFAKGPGGQNTPGFYGNDGLSSSYGIGARGAWAGGEGSLVEVAAQVIDIERIDLVAELSESISIADAAANHEVKLQDIVDTYRRCRSRQ